MLKHVCDVCKGELGPLKITVEISTPGTSKMYDICCPGCAREFFNVPDIVVRALKV